MENLMHKAQTQQKDLIDQYQFSEPGSPLMILTTSPLVGSDSALSNVIGVIKQFPG